MMKKVVRSGLAIIAAGSIGLTLTACGSKDKTDEALANRPTAITAELLNGPWVVIEQDGQSIKDSREPYNDNILWAIKDTKVGYVYHRGRSAVKCDDIKDAFASMKGDPFWKVNSEPGYDPQYKENHAYTFTYGGELNDTYTTFTVGSYGRVTTGNDVYDVQLNDGKLTFSLAKSSKSDPVRNIVLMRPDQGDATLLTTALCGEVPAWK